MNGIEKIKQRMESDVQKDIEKILSDAHAEADRITAGYQAQADREATGRRARNEKNAAQYEERLVGVAELEARKSNLAARQKMVDRAFSMAVDQLCSLPDDTYTATAAALLVKAAPDGKGEVVFSKEDRERIGQSTVNEANRLLKNGELKLSTQTRPLRGGFILVSGNVEVNCDFETLVRLQKNEMAGEVAKRLFSED